MNRLAGRACLLLSLLVISCAGPTVDRDAEGALLMQRSRDWSALAATGDLDSIMTYWAEDAVLLPPGGPALRGRAAIREYVEGSQQVPGFQIRWEPESVHVAESGDLAYMLERNVVTVNDSAGQPLTMHGKAVTVWRKDAGGTWRNVVDTWNDAPSPAP